MDVLIINPPAAKAGEPPLGMAVLLSHLRAQGVAAGGLDANLGAYLHLLDPKRLREAAGPSPSTALRRAVNHASRSIDLLRSPQASRSFSRYQTAVHHLNRALEAYSGDSGEERLTLGDYSHGGLSEFNPHDLERLAQGDIATLFDGYFTDQVLSRVAQQSPKVVAISVNYRHQVLPAFALAGLVRRHFPAITVVGGGGMVTSWKSALRENSLRFAAFSHIVFGPGEKALTSLCRGEPAGYFIEDSADIHFTPDFSDVRLQDYLSPQPILPVTTSRGCYWSRCLFCPEASSPTHPYSSAGPQGVVDLLRLLSKVHGVHHFHLTDNAVPVNVLRQLVADAEALADISWHGFVRFERALLDPDFVQGLAASGCRMLQLGLESGSQRVLDRLQKGTRLDEASTILRNLHRAGIMSYVYVMLGISGETAEDAEMTRTFLEDHAGDIDYLNIAIMNLPRESGLLADPGDAGIRDEGLLDQEAPLGLYRSFVSSTGWGRAEARRFLKQQLLGTPAIREIVGRTPAYFTSFDFLNQSSG